MVNYQASGGGAKRQLSADLAGAGPPAKKKRAKQVARASKEDDSQQGEDSSSDECATSSEAEAEADEEENKPIQRRAATSAKRSIRKAVSHGNAPDRAPVLKGTHGEEDSQPTKRRSKKRSLEPGDDTEVDLKRKITGFKQDDLKEDEDLLHSQFVSITSVYATTF